MIQNQSSNFPGVPCKALKIVYPREIFTGGANEVAIAGVSDHSSSCFLPLRQLLPYLTSQAGWVGSFSVELGAYTVNQVPWKLFGQLGSWQWSDFGE